MAKKKKEVTTIYIVGRKLRPKQCRSKRCRSGNHKVPIVNEWSYIKVFTDYDVASDFVDMERNAHPQYLYIIEEH